MLEAGYAPSVARHNPTVITEAKGFQELLAESMPQSDILDVHKSLLKSTKLDHMVFPLGPDGEDDVNFSGGVQVDEADDEDLEDDDEPDEMEDSVERTTLTDKEIISMLAEVNCTVRRIVHGRSARHVYFWSPDNRARKDGLDMAYKIMGKYAGDAAAAGARGNTYNFFYAPQVREVAAKYEDELEKVIEQGNAKPN